MASTPDKRPLGVLVTCAIALLAALLCVDAAAAKDWYMAPWDKGGRDTNSGTKSSPFYSLPHATSRMSPGDRLLLRGGSYYPHNTWTITKSGSSGNPITITRYQQETPIINGREIHSRTRHGDSIWYQFRDAVVVTGSHVNLSHIQVTNNQIGSGVIVTPPFYVDDQGREIITGPVLNVTLSNIRATNLGGPGISVWGQNSPDWGKAPRNITVRNSHVEDTCRRNWAGTSSNPNWYLWKEPNDNWRTWKQRGAGWPIALGALGAVNVKFENNVSKRNHGEGIGFSRVIEDGGDSHIKNSRAEDNWSMNVYLDAVSGRQWTQNGQTKTSRVVVYKNTAKSGVAGDAWKYERNGNPAQGFGIAAESYDGIGVGSMNLWLLKMEGNKAYDCGHGFEVRAGYGPTINDVLFTKNETYRSTWEGYKVHHPEDTWRLTVRPDNIGFGF